MTNERVMLRMWKRQGGDYGVVQIYIIPARRRASRTATADGRGAVGFLWWEVFFCCVFFDSLGDGACGVGAEYIRIGGVNLLLVWSVGLGMGREV